MRKNGGRFIDMSNQKIDQALVLNINDNYAKEHNIKNKAIYWNCQCLLCGNVFVKEGRKLRKNGCKEGCPECIKKRKSKQFSNNFKGQIFCDIYVIDRDDEYKNNHNYVGNDVIWKCKCLICGNIFHSNNRFLKNRILSGCPTCNNPKKSIGEIKIENILKENNIKYIYNQSYFKDLVGEKKMPLRYDFILFDENNQPFKLIEFDGRQHFIIEDYFGGEEGFYQRQQADRLKNIYALKNNLPLIRIRYNEEKYINQKNLLYSEEYLIIDENGNRKKDLAAH